MPFHVKADKRQTWRRTLLLVAVFLKLSALCVADVGCTLILIINVTLIWVFAFNLLTQH